MEFQLLLLLTGYIDQEAVLTISERLAKIGIGIPRITLPKSSLEQAGPSLPAINLHPGLEYWEETRRIAGDNPSTLNLIIPECYLQD